MATDNPNGFTPVGHLMGGVTAELSQAKHTWATGYATAVFRGDMLSVVAAGTVARSAAGSEELLGAFAGVKYVDASGNQIFSNQWVSGTAATEIEVMCYDDPYIIYRIQQTGTWALTHVGENADHVATAGSTSTGRSLEELSSTTAAATAGFRILGTVNEPGNTGADVDVMVIINEGHIRKLVGV